MQSKLPMRDVWLSPKRLIDLARKDCSWQLLLYAMKKVTRFSSINYPFAMTSEVNLQFFVRFPLHKKNLNS